MRPPLFGQFLLESGVIKTEQLTKALEYQHEVNQLLGELAADMGWLNYDAVPRILNRQRYEDKDFGEIAVELGYLTEKMRNKLLEIQQYEHIRLGELLVATKMITQSELDSQLENFQKLQSAQTKTQVSPKSPSYTEDSSDNFFKLVCRVLPRVTHGLFMPGIYYQTILPILSEHVFNQRLRGDIDVEVVFHLTEGLLADMGKALLGRKTAHSADKGRKNMKYYERAVKKFINITARLFVVSQQEKGIKFSFPPPPTRLKQTTYLKRRQKAGKVNCIEIILNSPSGSQGEPLQFHLSLLYR